MKSEIELLSDKKMRHLAATIGEAMRSVDLRALRKAMERPPFQLSKELGERIRSVISQGGLREVMRGHDARFIEALNVLAQHGWFIAPWLEIAMADVHRLAMLFKNGHNTAANRGLCAFFNEALGDIEVELSKRFPLRATILEKAFTAHRRGDFELSIPVFLAQADGIMIDTVAKPEKKYSIYSRHKAPTLRELIENIATVDFERDILTVALLQVPLNDADAHKFASGEIVNRNAVLHGLNLSYANKPNSCRAISWLRYVAYFDEAKKAMSRRKKLTKNLMK
jgi:hypothetical protein